MTLNVLKTDRHSKVVEKLVLGWSVTTDRGATVTAAFEYKDYSSDRKQELPTIQFGLTPQQALQLAQALTEVATDILRNAAPDASR